MDAHFISGYALITLLLFRLGWGVIGSDTARFSRFLKPPTASLRHLRRFARREPDTEIGHNAAGGWMVLLMLVLLAVQAGTGLFATNDVDTEGPFAERVSPSTSEWLSHVHAINFIAIEIAVLLHVTAVLAYAVIKRQNLIWPMITGRKHLPTGSDPPRMRSTWLAAGLLAFAACAVALVFAFLSD